MIVNCVCVQELHVPPGVYHELMEAPSLGRFLNLRVKGVYEFA